MHDLSGTNIGPYQLIEQIGKGGMAAVYRARQPSVDRDVAIKVLSSDLADSDEFLARFEREARIIAALQHPNILAVHDFGREGQFTYLVMRLMRGSLEDEIRAGPMPAERVIAVTHEIAAALDYAHGHGVVHRDLKPSNVLMDEQGNAYLTDFGIAKMLGGSVVSEGITAPGVVMGTPTYMAPEQWRAEVVDGRADVYALGVLIYQMLLGTVPFAAETPHGLMYLHLDMEPPSPRAIRPDLPFSIEPVIRKALAKDREQRQASAGELAADLARALLYPDRPAAPAPAPGIPRRPVRPSPPPARPLGLDQQIAEDNLMALADDAERADLDRAPRPPRTHEPRPASPARTRPAYPPSAPPPIPEPRPSSPVVTGYTDPYRAPEPPVRREVYAPDRGGGLSQFIWIPLALIVALGILFGLVLVIALLATSEEGQSREPTLPAPTPRATDIPPERRANVTISSPATNTVFNLGDTVTIQFTASHASGITRVELRRFGQTINTVLAGGQTVFQGWFAYPANDTGTHILEVVPWSGDIPGNPASVVIVVR